MKKGASHVDWAISMGIFLVFIMLTFIFLRPGTEQVYKGDVLLKIIEDGLKEKGYYTVEKQLLFIDYSGSGGTWDVRIREASNNGLNPDWVKDGGPRKYTAMMNETQTKFDEEDGEDVKIVADVCNDYCDGDPCGGYYPEIPYNKYVLDFETRLEHGDNLFYILHNDNFIYDTFKDSSSGSACPLEVDIAMKDDAIPGTAAWTCSNCRLDTKVGEDYNFTYEFGVPETYIGFSEEKMLILKNENYESLKGEWNIPTDKNFRLNITNLTTCTPNPYRILTDDECENLFKGYSTDEQIPPGISVFVKEWRDWVLKPEGELAPVEVHVEIW